MDIEYIDAKTMVTKVSRPAEWFGYEYNMNIYRGCSHGCIYCDSRSSCYRIDNFSKIKVKKDALTIIRDELRRKVKSGVIATGSMSDPYNPLEKELQLTRHALELFSAFEFGVSIATKSTLITRDIDILNEIREHSPAIAEITVTTWEKDLCKIIEPNVPSSQERFEAIAKLSDAGIFSGILFMPVLPFINDSDDNIKNIVKATYDSGARFIYPTMGVTMRDTQREYYYDALDRYFPGIKEQYIKRYRNHYHCAVPGVKKKWAFFTSECERYGLLYHMKDIISAYKMGYESPQLRLF